MGVLTRVLIVYGKISFKKFEESANASLVKPCMHGTSIDFVAPCDVSRRTVGSIIKTPVVEYHIHAKVG